MTVIPSPVAPVIELALAEVGTINPLDCSTSFVNEASIMDFPELTRDVF